MLQFWKKTKKDRTNQPPLRQNVNGVSLPVGVLIPTLSDSNLEGPLAHFHHDGYTDKPPPQRSRLSLNLTEALNDQRALLYFYQFAELRGYSLLLNLFLDLQELRKKANSSVGDCGDSILNSVGDECSTHNNSGDSKFISELMFRTHCLSDSASPITCRKLCLRYFTEDVMQRYRFPEEICMRIQVTVNQKATDDAALQQLQEFAYQTLRRELWHDFVRSEYFSKFQVEVLTSGSVSLSDILYHSAALNAFTEFLEQEGCECVIEFWLTATAFQNQLRPDSDPTTSQNEAIHIYEKYLSLQATNLLGIDDTTRCEVEQLICVEGAAPRKDCLEPALRKAWAYLQYVCLPLFLSSQRYVQLISELMRATRASSSPASSVTDVSIESSRNRYDPDLIWRRRHHNRGLTIGRIDQLGRFETDIEPEPDKKSESRITRVVKKLVNKDEQKAQEEMAWRVAEMIVKDVTNLTMGGQVEDEDDT